MTLTFEQIKTHMVPHEGNIAHMYVDTTGNVTVGIGNKLPSVASAQALPFVRKSDLKAATAAEIQADFQSVKARPGVHLADSYESYTKCKMKPFDIDMLFRRRVDEFLRGVRGLYSGYDTFPDSAQLAILDMAFNLGIGGLERNWPRFNAAVRAQDWTEAANQCHRRGIPASRNTATQALFLSALDATATASGSQWPKGCANGP